MTIWIFIAKSVLYGYIRIVNNQTMGLADNIKHLREEKGFLQKQVATELGLGTSHYSKIENGQREASVELLDKLATFYGITLGQVGGTYG